MTGHSGPEHRRRALLLACARFADPALPHLRSPVRDVKALGAVLADPAGPGYEVLTEVDCTAHQARLAIERFFATARPRDLHLLYFSCHGIQGAHGDLYFAFSDTRSELPDSTAVAAEWVRARMQSSRSRTTIVLVDCCFSGAFVRGMRAKSGGDANVGALVRDLPEGSGVAVLTASGATEYSLESTHERTGAAARSSYFTEAVFTGISTGAADLDRDGLITVDELYTYIYRRILDGPSPQRPRKMGHTEGQVVVAPVARRTAEPPVPPEPPDREMTLIITPDTQLVPWPPLPPIAHQHFGPIRPPPPASIWPPPPRPPASIQPPPPASTQPLSSVPIRGRSVTRPLVMATVAVALLMAIAVLANLNSTTLIVVPNVFGQQRASANDVLTDLGLRVEVRTIASRPDDVGKVIGVEPPPGSNITPGSTVTLNVGSGPDLVLMPNLNGKTKQEAKTILSEAGLTPVWGEEAVRDQGWVGKVIKQDPEFGTPVNKSTQVHVTLGASDPPTTVTVINVIGSQQETGQRQLEALGFNVDLIYTDSTKPANEIVKQNPKAGTKHDKGTTITLSISNGGPSTVVTPPTIPRPDPNPSSTTTTRPR